MAFERYFYLKLSLTKAIPLIKSRVIHPVTRLITPLMSSAVISQRILSRTRTNGASAGGYAFTQDGVDPIMIIVVSQTIKSTEPLRRAALSASEGFSRA